MNYDDYKESRRVVAATKDGSTSYKKGNRAQSLNICSKCGAVLTTFQLNTGKYTVSRSFVRYKFATLHLNLCKDPRVCYNSYIKRRKE